MNFSNNSRSWYSPLKSWYFLILIAFVTWMVFFDGNDVGTQMRLKNKLISLDEEKIQLHEKIEQTNKALTALREDKEKFAREKYYMKKDGEDVFIIDKK